MCNISVAETYHFKDCKLSSAVLGDYVINLEKKIIEVKLHAVDGKVQNFSDKIKLVKKT